MFARPNAANQTNQSCQAVRPGSFKAAASLYSFRFVFLTRIPMAASVGFLVFLRVCCGLLYVFCPLEAVMTADYAKILPQFYGYQLPTTIYQLPPTNYQL